MRRHALRLLLALAAIVAVGGWWWVHRPDPTKMFVFPGVSGPSQSSVAPDPKPTAIAQFDHGSPHRLAVLVTDPNSGWLGLVRAFHAHGVPVTVTTDPARALSHEVVLVYPIISGRMDPPVLQQLGAHVRGGGAVLGFNLAGGGLQELFGVTEGIETRGRTTLAWTARGGVPEEDVIRVSHAGESQMGTIGYRATTADVLARFDDGSAAVTCRSVVGKACLMGVDLGALGERTMNGRGESFSRDYVNGYEPSLDVLVDWVRDLYLAQEPMPWIISSTPPGKQLSILLTHDVDYTRSVANSVEYARALQALGARATFFVQTKYMKDYNDDVFFNDRTLPQLRALAASGMDLQSHTVAHSRSFEAFPMGSGHERYPAYRPFVKSRAETRGGTVMGEARVSKFLLEQLTGAQVRSFRPGYLAYPFILPQALAASGYLYSSSITAGSTLTHLPYQLTIGRADGSLAPLYEFPVTIEDEESPLGGRGPQEDAVLAKIGRRGGVAVVLIHPDITGEKLTFETNLVRNWRDRAWIGPLTDFGDWWRGRDQAEVDLVPQRGGWALQAGGGAAVHDVVVITPKLAHKRYLVNRRKGERAAGAVQ